MIFFEGSSLPLLAFVLALLEPWQDDLMQCEDLPEGKRYYVTAIGVAGL